MYIWRHNKVLEVIIEFLRAQCETANQQSITAKELIIQFLKEGECPVRKQKNPNMKLQNGANDWCWTCGRIGHMARFCPLNAGSTEGAAATTAAAAATTITGSRRAEAWGPGLAQPRAGDREGWTEVARRRRESPKQGEAGGAHPLQKQAGAPPSRESATGRGASAVPATLASPAAPVSPVVPATPTTRVTPTSPATPVSPVVPATLATPASPTTPTSKRPKKKSKQANQPAEETPMETSSNLKRKRDSGEGAAKNMCPEKSHPKACLSFQT